MLGRSGLLLILCSFVSWIAVSSSTASMQARFVRAFFSDFYHLDLTDPQLQKLLAQ